MTFFLGGFKIDIIRAEERFLPKGGVEGGLILKKNYFLRIFKNFTNKSLILPPDPPGSAAPGHHVLKKKYINLDF